jgi:exosortase
MHYIIWLLIVAIYSPVFWDLYRSRWESIDYTHAYFVLPISLWVVWQKRKDIHELYKRFQPQLSDWIGLGSSAIGSFLFIIGWRQEYLFVMSLSLIFVLWGAVRFLYGRAVVRSLRFPIFFLLFLIPPPVGILDAITMPMRFGISHVVEVILSVLGYPISRTGLMLTMGQDEIFMGAPCSGFRSLITMLTLAVAYVYFVKANFLKKCILIPAVVPIALLGNLIRVMTLCLVTYYAGHEAAEGFFHDFSGALIFTITIGCLMALDFFIDRNQKRRGDHA